MKRTIRLMLLATAIPVVLALIPTPADAQRVRGGAGVRSGGGAVRSGGGAIASGGTAVLRGGSVRGGGGVYHGGGWYGHGWYGGGWYGGWGGYWGPYWGPYWGWGYAWDPLWYGPYWGGPYYRYWGPADYDESAELRLEVTPKQAQVFVDGYYAGVVDDFDGVFQRLHVHPGRHELAIYLPGYHTVRQNLYLSADQDSKVKFAMVPLGPGEQNDPAPQPVNPPRMEEGYGYQDQPQPPAQAQRPPRTATPPRPIPPPEPQQPSTAVTAQPGQGYGSLVIRVQPAGADVLIDGERWQGPEVSERLVIQVAEGSHKVEVRKDGYAPYSTTVSIKGGETMPINVSLPKGQ